jgi:hypothetical protein
MDGDCVYLGAPDDTIRIVVPPVKPCPLNQIRRRDLRFVPIDSRRRLRCRRAWQDRLVVGAVSFCVLLKLLCIFRTFGSQILQQLHETFRLGSLRPYGHGVCGQHVHVADLSQALSNHGEIALEAFFEFFLPILSVSIDDSSCRALVRMS